MASFIGRAQHSAAVLRSPNISLSKKVGGTTRRAVSFFNHQIQRGQNDELKVSSSSFAKVGVVSGATSSFEWSGANQAAVQEDHNGDYYAFAKHRQQDKSKMKAGFIGKTIKLDGAQFISPHQPMEVGGRKAFAKDRVKMISSRNFYRTKAGDEVPIEYHIGVMSSEASTVDAVEEALEKLTAQEGTTWIERINWKLVEVHSAIPKVMEVMKEHKDMKAVHEKAAELMCTLFHDVEEFHSHDTFCEEEEKYDWNLVANYGLIPNVLDIMQRHKHIKTIQGKAIELLCTVLNKLILWDSSYEDAICEDLPVSDILQLSFNDAMRNFPDDENIQSGGVSLFHWAWYSEDGLMGQLMEGVVPQPKDLLPFVFGFLKSRSGCVSQAEKCAANILWEMSGKDEDGDTDRQLIIDAGGVDLILSCLLQDDCTQAQKNFYMQLLRRVLYDHSKENGNINDTFHGDLDRSPVAEQINHDVKTFGELAFTKEGRQHIIDTGGIDTIVNCLLKADCSQGQKDSYMRLLRCVLQDHSKDTSEIDIEWHGGYYGPKDFQNNIHPKTGGERDF